MRVRLLGLLALIMVYQAVQSQHSIFYNPSTSHYLPQIFSPSMPVYNPTVQVHQSVQPVQNVQPVQSVQTFPTMQSVSTAPAQIFLQNFPTVQTVQTVPAVQTVQAVPVQVSSFQAVPTTFQAVPAVQSHLPAISAVPSFQNVFGIPTVSNVASFPTFSNMGSYPTVSNIANLPTIPSVASLPSIPEVGSITSVREVDSMSTVPAYSPAPHFREILSSYTEYDRSKAVPYETVKRVKKSYDGEDDRYDAEYEESQAYYEDTYLDDQNQNEFLMSYDDYIPSHKDRSSYSFVPNEYEFVKNVKSAYPEERTGKQEYPEYIPQDVQYIPEHRQKNLVPEYDDNQVPSYGSDDDYVQEVGYPGQAYYPPPDYRPQGVYRPPQPDYYPEPDYRQDYLPESDYRPDYLPESDYRPDYYPESDYRPDYYGSEPGYSDDQSYLPEYYEDNYRNGPYEIREYNPRYDQYSDRKYETKVVPVYVPVEQPSTNEFKKPKEDQKKNYHPKISAVKGLFNDLTKVGEEVGKLFHQKIFPQHRNKREVRNAVPLYYSDQEEKSHHYDIDEVGTYYVGDVHKRKVRFEDYREVPAYFVGDDVNINFLLDNDFVETFIEDNDRENVIKINEIVDNIGTVLAGDNENMGESLHDSVTNIEYDPDSSDNDEDSDVEIEDESDVASDYVPEPEIEAYEDPSDNYKVSDNNVIQETDYDLEHVRETYKDLDEESSYAEEASNAEEMLSVDSNEDYTDEAYYEESNEEKDEYTAIFKNEHNYGGIVEEPYASRDEYDTIKNEHEDEMEVFDEFRNESNYGGEMEETYEAVINKYFDPYNNMKEAESKYEDSRFKNRGNYGSSQP